MSDHTSLRKGWTTGACAAAAAKAAACALVDGCFPDPVTIVLPHGLTPSFSLSRAELQDGEATAGVIKDAGDDPDVTHGAEIVVRVKRTKRRGGIVFHAGEGVGTVTLPGLPLPPGEPAINPSPRAMISRNIEEAMRCAQPGVDVTVCVPNGKELAAHTMNARLGILGGLSILGTTGVVIPYSCSAWIHSIRQGLNVARAAGITHIAAVTGKTSETGVRILHGLNDQALIDMGNFSAALLSMVRKHPVARLTIAGGFAKMVKLAMGAEDLHSSAGGIDMVRLAEWLAETGVVLPQEKKEKAVSGAQILAQSPPLPDGRRPLADLVARRARETALAALGGGTAVDVAVFSRSGELIGYA